MVQTTAPPYPQTLNDFMNWEPMDGFKYEWFDGTVVQFTGMKKKQYYLYAILNKLFVEEGYHQTGTLMAEPDVMLTAKQMRRPDIAYFTDEQVQRGRQGEDVIPAFVIEIISETDQAYAIEAKLIEYFKAGVAVVWKIMPEQELVYVYTSRRHVTLCMDQDVCSAAPVLPEFTIRVDTLFAPA